MKHNCEACQDDGVLPNGQGCPDCCPHYEHDHYICLDCGLELEASDYYDEDAGLDR